VKYLGRSSGRVIVQLHPYKGAAAALFTFGVLGRLSDIDYAMLVKLYREPKGLTPPHWISGGTAFHFCYGGGEAAQSQFYCAQQAALLGSEPEATEVVAVCTPPEVMVNV
jgi:hypothetical protein